MVGTGEVEEAMETQLDLSATAVQDHETTLPAGVSTPGKVHTRPIAETRTAFPAPPHPELIETPENGIKGLKHFRHDVLAGLVVALVSVPLSLGIAIASGVPPICGITSEIIAGLVFPFLGGAYMTISGPAAGLAPVIMSVMLSLGHGDLTLGYHMILGVIMMAGVLQLILTYFKCAKFSHLFPNAAIQGMLASIGVMLFAKQFAPFMGVKFHAHDCLPMIAEIPSHLAQINPVTMIIGCVCLGALFWMQSIKSSFTKFCPPQLLVVVLGAVIAKALHLDTKFLVHVPDNPLAHAIVLPDFKLLFSNPGIWPAILGGVLMLTFVDGTESLATIKAVDRMDPFKRKSSPDRTLAAMGVSNICSSLIGGLTIIPGIIKSTTNTVSGGRTAWVNFYNAVFLILFLVVAKDVINCIPLAALAAVLANIAYKLAGPHKWKHMASVGMEQLIVFTTTILVTITSDLLIGIFAGMGVKLLLLTFYSVRAAHTPHPVLPVILMDSIVSLFKNPIDHVEQRNRTMDVYVSGPLDCFNSLAVRDVFEHVPSHIRNVRVHIGNSVTLIDHSVGLYLQGVAEDCKRHNISFEIHGLNALQARSNEATGLKVRPAGISVRSAGV